MARPVTLLMTASSDDDRPVVPMTWVCGYAAPPDKMTVKGTNNTTVPAKNLPLKFREG